MQGYTNTPHSASKYNGRAHRQVSNCITVYPNVSNVANCIKMYQC